MSATDPKGGESLVGYPRDVYPLRRVREVVDELAEHERAIMERVRRRVLATLVNPEPVEDPDFPGCVW